MPGAGQRDTYYINTNVIRIKKKQKRFHRKFHCDTTFSFTNTHL
jgi:hypothetical protein